MQIVLEDNMVFKIVPDDIPESPRDWDHLGKMICFHKKYKLGDDFDDYNLRAECFANFDSLEKYLRNEYKAAVILPLYLMDHSGISMKTTSENFRSCDPMGWDWGRVGFIFATHEDILKEFNAKRNISQKMRSKVEEMLRCEVEVYDQYLRGDVWGFSLMNSEGDIVDSCWGFYGSDLKENGMLDHIPQKYHQHLKEVV